MNSYNGQDFFCNLRLTNLLQVLYIFGAFSITANFLSLYCLELQCKNRRLPTLAGMELTVSEGCVRGRYGPLIRPLKYDNSKVPKFALCQVEG